MNAPFQLCGTMMSDWAPSFSKASTTWKLSALAAGRANRATSSAAARTKSRIASPPGAPRPRARRHLPSRHPIGWRRRSEQDKKRDLSRNAASAPAAAGGHGAVHVALLHALADRRALVVQLLAASQAELGLGATLHPVEPQRHQREPALLDLPAQLVELAAVQQELALTLRVMAELAGGAVRADVDAHQEELVAEEAGVGVLQVDAAVAERLHLAPDERQPRLQALVEMVLVEGPPVDGDVAVAGLVAHPGEVRNPMSTRWGTGAPALRATPGPGTSARFSRIRLCSSTKTTLGR